MRSRKARVEHTLALRQLYHDREEVTGYCAATSAGTVAPRRARRRARSGVVGDDAQTHVGRPHQLAQRGQRAPEPERRDGRDAGRSTSERRRHADGVRQRAGGEIAERRDAEKRQR